MCHVSKISPKLNEHCETATINMNWMVNPLFPILFLVLHFHRKNCLFIEEIVSPIEAASIKQILKGTLENVSFKLIKYGIKTLA